MPAANNRLPCALAILLCSAVALSQAQAQVVLVPRGDCNWKFFQPTGNLSVVEWSQPSFNDAAWIQNCAPFRAPWACDQSGGTAIPRDGYFFMRHHIYNPLPRVVYARYELWTRGVVGGIYYNGRESCGGGRSSDCPLPDSPLTCIFPLEPGDNVLLFHYFSAGGANPIGGWIDARITSDDLTPVLGRTWGSLKIAYR